MNKTYDDILVEMKKAYFDECGENVSELSETYKRFQAVASELFALSTYGDYIFKQSFVQTATGNFLDRHGSLRGCIRKTSSRAMGELIFSILEPATQDIIIPENTVCSVFGKPFLQYATTDTAVIAAGESSVCVSAASLENGEMYNIAAEKITVMVNAPVGISAVTNPKSFTGGCDEESDSAFRERIIRSYLASPNVVGSKSIESIICGFDFVNDCRVAYSDTTDSIEVVAIAKSGDFTEEQKQAMIQSIGVRELLGTDVSIIQAKPQDYSIVAEIKIRGGFDKKEIINNVKDEIKAITSALRIGEELALNRLAKQLVKLNALSEFRIYSTEAYAEVIVCNSNSYLHLNELAVNCFD